VLDELETRAIDLAIVPLDDVPQRFAARTLYEEDFVVAARAGHPFAAEPSLERYCEMRHLVVSLTGDPHGIFDEALTGMGLTRRVAVTVPNFMQALMLLAETDLLAALPRRLVEMRAARFGLVGVELPLPWRAGKIQAVATRAAMMDPGVAWLFEMLGQAGVDARCGALASRRMVEGASRTAGE
jgi:DNA-binding transcriptional LysR family regulator